MNQLNSVTYINAASIPFAKVDLDGNTLMVGANGAGKTTVLRSALYFYGVHENSSLGINIRKKKGFTDYYFHQLNSFIGYRYSNSLGNVLVVAYRSANSNVKFKFVQEDKKIDDIELFLEDKVARSPKELWKKLSTMGYTVSESISKLSDYRNIIYGNAGEGYKRYAFFNAKDDYKSFIHVLSNIFINSKLDASSIQKTISNAISGFEPIDLEQIDRSIDDFRQKYDDVTKFEVNRTVVEEILHALHQYEQHNTHSKERVNQLQSNKKEFLLRVGFMQEKIAEDNKYLDTVSITFDSVKKDYEFDSKTIQDNITVLNSQISTAQNKLKEYKEKSIDEKLELYALKDRYLSEYDAAQKKLDELTNTQSGIKEKFISLRETEKNSFEKKLRDIDNKILNINEQFQDKREKIDVDEKEELAKLQTDSKPKLTSLQIALSEASQKKDETYKAKIEAEHKTFLKGEISSLRDKSIDDKTLYSELNSDIEKYKSNIENINVNISSTEKEQELELEVLKNSHQPKIDKLKTEIEELNKFLDVDKESFLGFVKEVKHPHENLITSLLKDDVLLSTTLEPSFSNVDDKFFGFSIDSDEVSDYSKDKVVHKIDLAESDIKTIEKQLKTEQEELHATFRSRLNELRRQYRTNKEALDIAEVKLPKLKIEYLKSEDELRELEEKSQKLKDETLLSANKSYEKAKLDYAKSQNDIESFEAEVDSKKSSILHKTIENKEAISREKQIDIELQESAKVSENQAYLKKIEIVDNEEAEVLLNDGIDEKLLYKYKDEIRNLKSKLDEIRNIEDVVHRYKHDKNEHFDPLEQKLNERDSLEESKTQKDNEFNLVKNKFKSQRKQLLNTLDEYNSKMKDISNDLESMEKYLEANHLYREKIDEHEAIDVDATDEKLQDILYKIGSLEEEAKRFIDDMRVKQDLLYRNFTPNNSLDLVVRSGGEAKDVIKNGYELRDFMNDGKIEEFQEGVSSLFSLTINQLTKQTESLLEARESVDGIVTKIKNMLKDLEGISVIDKIDLRTQQSHNSILLKLEKLQELNAEYDLVSEPDLFNFDKPRNKNSKDAIKIIASLRKELDATNKKELILDDTYSLEIRASENGNDTGWQVSLDEVGSNGTDVMIKAIVNIAMLSISLGYKAKSESHTYFHCILDEIGVLHPSYLKELITYANNKHIRFLNGAPNRQLVGSFKRIYILANKNQNTMIKPLLSKQ